MKKSLPSAILLTIVLGPIGLFYSTVIGGLIMTFGPIVAAIFYSLANNADTFQELIASIVFFLLTYGFLGFAIYWPICIVWATISTHSHNKKVHVQSVTPVPKVDNPTSNSSHIKKWLQENPNKTLNDYYSKTTSHH